jgi:hypothetical protein
MGVMKSEPEPFAALEANCEQIRQSPIKGGLPGFTVFPGQTFPEDIGFAKWSVGTNVAAEEVQAATKGSSNKLTIVPFIVGCIDYTFGTDSERHHQTTFSYGITRLDAEHRIEAVEGKLFPPSLALQQSIFGSGSKAD